MVLVVDASVAFSWIAKTQAGPLTDAALTEVTRDGGWVTSYFGIEIARALRSHERRNLLTAEQVDVGLAQLQGLLLNQDRSDTLAIAPSIVALARQHTLRIADASYLELALRMASPIATRDAALARAAENAGARLFIA